MTTSKSILPQIDISIEVKGWPDEDALRALIEKAVIEARSAAGLNWPSEAELSVVFADNAKMAEINGQWRGKEKPTNVLSFPGSDISIGESADMMIGDLVFALETIQNEANEQDKRFEDHLLHLIIHGFLHLFGYDHMTQDEAGQMEALEITALGRLGIANPYA